MNGEVRDNAGLCDVSQDWTWRLSGNCLNDVTLVAGLVMVMTSAVTWSAAYTVVAVPVVKTLRSVSAFRRQVALLLPVFADVISCLGSGLSDQSPAVIVVACLSLAVNCLWCLLYLCQKPADNAGYRKVEEESEDSAKLSPDMKALWLVLAISTSLLATTAYVIWRYDVTDTWAVHPMKVPEDVGWMWGMTSGCLGAVLHWLAFLARLSTQQCLPPGERLVLWGVGVMSMADSWLVTGAWLLLHPPVHLLPSLPWLIDRAGFVIIGVSYLLCRHTGRRLIPACCFQRQHDTESGHNEDDIASWGIWKKQKESLQERRGIFDFGTFAASGPGDRRREGKGREGQERREGKPLPSSLSSAPESLYGALQNCYEWDTEDQTEPDSGDEDLDLQDSGYNTSYRKVTSPRRPSFNRHLARLSSEAREERVQEWVMSHDHVTAKNDVIIPRHSVDMSPEDETPRQFPCEVISNEGRKTIPSRGNLNSYVHRSFSTETAHTNLFDVHPMSPYDVGRILAEDDEDDVTLFMRDDVRPRRNTTFDHGLTDNFMNVNRSSSELSNSRPSFAMNHASSASSLRCHDAVVDPVNHNKTFDTTREGWRRRNTPCLNGRNNRQQSSESSRTDTSATTTTTTSTGDVFHDNNNNGGDDDVVLSSPCSGVSSPRCWLQWRRPDLSTSRSVTDMSVFQ